MGVFIRAIVMIVIDDPRKVESALSSMYNRLADFLMENIDLDRVSMVLEAGCGSGRLTIPLAEKLGAKRRIIAFDISSGPYEGDLEVLEKTVRKKGVEELIETVKGDVRNMEGIQDEKIDLIVSNELFCDLDRRGLERALKEFYRILKPKGQMAHAELNPFPENRAQQLLIESNSYSLETLTPRPEWFSPHADEVAVLMHKTGFRDIYVKFFETNLIFGFKAAAELLKTWKIDPKFNTKYEKALRRHGLEFPMEHVIFCEKPDLL